MHNVHAEYMQKRNDVSRRLWHVEKAIANPDSPYSTFSTGNLDTLNRTVLPAHPRTQGQA